MRPKGSSPKVRGAMLLPHERDETPDGRGEPRAKIVQAARDIESGKIDTDNYSRIGGWFNRLFKRND